MVEGRIKDNSIQGFVVMEYADDGRYYETLDGSRIDKVRFHMTGAFSATAELDTEDGIVEVDEDERIVGGMAYCQLNELFNGDDYNGQWIELRR